MSRKNVSKKINDTWEWQKKQRNSTSWQKKVMSEIIRGYDTGEEGGEVGTLLLHNGKNNVIVNKKKKLLFLVNIIFC